MRLICITWATADTINTLILITYIVTVWVIYKTFKEGKRQTTISLSISQYNILYKELLDLIEDAKNIKFKSDLGEEAHVNIRTRIDEANGIYYIPLFLFTSSGVKFLKKDDAAKHINDFRHNILFPLVRYYDRLYQFLEIVIKDEILEPNHKNYIYNKVERDLLQTYFRVCNYQFMSEKPDYDLIPFETEKFNADSFYRINKLFIEKNLFQFKDLEFYKETT